MGLLKKILSSSRRGGGHLPLSCPPLATPLVLMRFIAFLVLCAFPQNCILAAFQNLTIVVLVFIILFKLPKYLHSNESKASLCD